MTGGERHPLLLTQLHELLGGRGRVGANECCFCPKGMFRLFSHLFVCIPPHSPHVNFGARAPSTTFPRVDCQRQAASALEEVARLVLEDASHVAGDEVGPSILGCRNLGPLAPWTALGQCLLDGCINTTPRNEPPRRRGRQGKRTNRLKRRSKAEMIFDLCVLIVLLAWRPLRLLAVKFSRSSSAFASSRS
jgi:hypothetical protein